MDLRCTGLRDAPNDVRVFFFTINVHGNTRYSKNGIPDQTEGIYTLFQTKMAKSIPYFSLEMLENYTLWGGTYLYGFLGVPPSHAPHTQAIRTTLAARCIHGDHPPTPRGNKTRKDGGRQFSGNGVFTTKRNYLITENSFCSS